MAQQISENRELKNIGYELFIGGLSILSITNLVLGVIVLITQTWKLFW